MTDVSNTDDIIDSRDVIKRISELEDSIHEVDETGKVLSADLDDDELEELAALRALADQAEGYAEDWRHGVALIRDSYFETYAEELADDIGAIDRNASWPLSCIDWKKAAEELQMDYTAVEFDGVTYWVR